MKEPFKVYTVSLGCPKNQTDTEKLLARLQELGGTPTLAPEEADLLLVNTCAFIRPAVQESIDVILELAELKRPGQRLAVVGCLVARFREEVLSAFPEVDFLGGIEAYRRPELLLGKTVRFCLRFDGPDTIQRVLSGNPFYAYLKITEGCRQACSFCAIPRIRGPLHSRPESEILQEAQELTAQGVREIILVGQDITAYGLDQGKRSLPALVLRLLQDLPEGVRLRLLYLHPEGITEDLLELFRTQPRLAPYADLPLQHAHSEILRRMRRFYAPEESQTLLEKWRALRPEMGFRTSIIVGFPGETTKHLETLEAFLHQMAFDHLGVFVFSPEEGTRAAPLPDQISEEEKRARFEEVMLLQQEVSSSLLALRLGEETEVLVEGRDEEDRLYGHARFQAPEVDGLTYLRGLAEPGDLVSVRLVESDVYDVVGEVLEVRRPFGAEE